MSQKQISRHVVVQGSLESSFYVRDAATWQLEAVFITRARRQAADPFLR